MIDVKQVRKKYLDEKNKQIHKVKSLDNETSLTLYVCLTPFVPDSRNFFNKSKKKKNPKKDPKSKNDDPK